MTTMVTTNYTDVFSGNLVGPAFPQYSAITLDENITLAWPTDFQNLRKVVSLIMDISPTVDDEYQITLPDATKSGEGFVFKINNPSNNDFDLLDNTGEHLTTINGGEAQEIWLVGNLTSAGSWRFLPMSGGSAVTYVDATSSSDNLTIAGVPIIGAGTIAFTLTKDLLALSTFVASTGFSARTAANSWTLRQITGTSGSINVTAGDGVSGNPTISLNPNISITSLVALTSVQGGNIELIGNSIASVNTNGAIDLEPNGTGPVTLHSTNPLKFYATNNTNYISFQGGDSVINQTYTWPTTLPTAGQSLGYSGGSILAWQDTPSVVGDTTINAIARYSNTVGGLKDSPTILLDDAGNLSLLNSCAIGQILIGGTGGSSPRTITTTLSDASLILAPNGIGAVQCQGDIWMYPVAGNSKKIRFYEPTGNHYAGFVASPTIANNYTWFLPPVGGIAGVFYTNTSNVMSIEPFFKGPSTVNAIATFSNTTGSIQDSNVTIDSSGTMLFLGSDPTIECDSDFEIVGGGLIAIEAESVDIITGINRINIFSSAALNMSSVGDTIISPSGNLILHGNLNISKASSNSMISIFNATNFSASIQANASTSGNYTLTLPSAVSAGYMRSDGSGNLSFLSLTTVATNIPQFTNTTGTIGSSPISVSAGGALTGVTSSTFSGMNVGVTSNTIATLSNANLNFAPNGTGIVASTADISLLLAATQLKLRLYNSAGTFYTALQAGAAAANTTFTLPIAALSNTGILKVSSAGVMAIDALGPSPGVLRTDGSGNVTVNSITTVDNTVPRFDGTGAIFQTSTAVLDDNENLLIAGATAATSVSRAIGLRAGTDPLGAATNMLSVGCKSTGSGTVLALYGGGDGGISASVSAVVTTKISIYVNGTRYYLLASTSGT